MRTTWGHAGKPTLSVTATGVDGKMPRQTARRSASVTGSEVNYWRGIRILVGCGNATTNAGHGVGEVYHVLNGGAGRCWLFRKAADFTAMEEVPETRFQ